MVTMGIMVLKGNKIPNILCNIVCKTIYLMYKISRSVLKQFFILRSEEHTEGTFAVKSGLAHMCKGGLIMDVVNVEQAKIAEEAGVPLSSNI